MASYYINAASAGGDGTTNGLSGPTAAYASGSAAEAAEQGDLSSIGKTNFLAEGTTNDTTKIVFSGWTNASATNYIQYESSGTGIHDGTADSGYVLAISSGHAIEVDVPYTRIGRAGFGIDIKSTSTTSSDEGIRFDLSAADLETCYVVGNIIRSTTSTSSKDGIYCNPSGGTSAITLNVFANIIYGWNRGGVHAQNFSGTNTMLANCIQNTCHGNGDGGSNTGDILGRDTASGTTTIDSFNNICASATSFRDQSATNTTWTGSNNVTLDGEFNRGSMTGGAQATSGITTTTQGSGAWIIFTNTTGGSEDYQLLDDSAGNLPVDYGTDKTATVPNDALGNSYATTPDNGAFELQSGATSALTGTMTATVDEDDITTGGKTIIITITGDTFKAAGTGPIGSTADTQALIDGFSASTSPGAGWNAEVRDKALTSEITRDSSTQATWLVGAQAGFDISAQQTVEGIIPTAVLVTGAGAITATPTFTIDEVATGRIMGSLAGKGGLAGPGGLAGRFGGLAG